MNDTTAGDPAASVLTVGQIGFDDAATLLAAFGLRLHRVAAGEKIPGSYWGEPEAGIIAANVYVRDDTPVHSMLHEACHLIVLPEEKRALVDTDATARKMRSILIREDLTYEKHGQDRSCDGDYLSPSSFHPVPNFFKEVFHLFHNPSAY